MTTPIDRRPCPARPISAPTPARPSARPSARSFAAAILAALGLALAAGGAQAQYKIVGPDGRVTYTDMPPPASAAGRVVDLGRRGAAAPDGPEGPAAAAPPLPAELRRVAERHPVTLFTGDRCPPCERGRELLQRRGVPYAERSVASADDIDALQARTGARTLPSLAIGSHVLRGWTDTEWDAYLDAAGYPRSSRLPPGWAPPPVQPLAPRAQAAAPPDAPQRAATPAAAPPSPAAALPAPAPDGIRF